MNKASIPKKILLWYDLNKRTLPWRNSKSSVENEYFTLVSEIMLQQTQVKTVIPFFERFVSQIPNLKALSKINEKKLLKLWEGLGYYSRAKNLKKTANILISKFNGRLPKTIDLLKTLPGVGSYTSAAIMAISFNKPYIPLDGNVERILKRIFYLKSFEEISKENLHNKKIFFGKSRRSSDYAQAIMELGALICKPTKPLCHKCPIKENCSALKKKDFELASKSKFNKIKYFQADVFKNKEKFYLIKNQKFNFLKNFLIFPMKEIDKQRYKKSLYRRINIKLSNMDMKIIINEKNQKLKLNNSLLIDKNKINKYILPSFTKKIFRSVSK